MAATPEPYVEYAAMSFLLLCFLGPFIIVLIQAVLEDYRRQ